MSASRIEIYRNGQAVRSRKFISQISNSWIFRLFLLGKLPMGFIAGLRIREINEMSSIVSVPYGYLNKNPFRSTYFAVLAMAAEMSTGLLAVMLVRNATPSFSMLVTNVEAHFTKKATSKTYFKCNDGLVLKQIIEQCIITGQAQTFRCRSIGTNEGGEEIAQFYITWSFKARM